MKSNKVLTNTVKVLGIDPSLNNWGLAFAEVTVLDEEYAVELSKLDIVQPILPEGKTVRKNSKDVSAAVQLYSRTKSLVLSADIVFVEVPIGSQSARAMASYGICVGVIGALESLGTPIIQLNPTEVKLATGLSSKATKAQMIDWAVNTFPDAPWPIKEVKGVKSVISTKAEHMADASAAIAAGLRTNEFKLLTMS